jgi:hypothetical protein
LWRLWATEPDEASETSDEVITESVGSSFRDLSVFGQATYLKVPRRQFYCHGCQRYFTESLSFVDEGRTYTRRYEEYIYQQVQQSSIEQVSRIEHLTYDRVEGIFKHQYGQKKTMDGKGLSDLESMKSVDFLQKSKNCECHSERNAV